MNKYKHYFFITILLFLIIFSFICNANANNNEIVLEFFYSEGCSHCNEKKPIVDRIEQNYSDNITVLRLSISNSENKNIFFNYGFTTTPGVVVKNLPNSNYTLFPYENITEENLKNIINYYLSGNYSEKPPENTENKTFCFFGLVCIDISQLSLPVLTITLAFLDSFNPCSFFILIFLLNLLLYVQSRRRMLLVGGIFIFFSGLIYFLLMAAILNVFLIVEQQIIITIIAGAFAVVFGALNIKDFFFFKQGPSLSISEEKKSNLFKKMRKIVQTSFLPSVIIGTVVLSIFANTYELLCTLGLPLVYTTELASYNLDAFQYFLYLFFYNIIYVIPLLIILSIFIITLGGRKLSEWQGRLLKLVSGIMMFSLGIALLIKPDLLNNIFITLGIILLSIILTILISTIWRKIVKNHKFDN